MFDYEAMLAQLAGLAADWDGFGGQPIGAGARDAMRTLCRALIVTPTRRGGLALEAHGGGLDLEVVVSPEGRIVAVTMAWDGP